MHKNVYVYYYLHKSLDLMNGASLYHVLQHHRTSYNYGTYRVIKP